MIEVQVTGADKLARVAKALKDAGDAGLRKELYRGLNRATKSLRADMRAHVPDRLPRRGGLGTRAARTTFRSSVRAGRDPGVRLVAGKNALRDPGSIDRGRVRHPVFGHKPYVLQDIIPSAFTAPFDAGAPTVRDELLHVLDDVAARIARA